MHFTFDDNWELQRIEWRQLQRNNTINTLEVCVISLFVVAALAIRHCSLL